MSWDLNNMEMWLCKMNDTCLRTIFWGIYLKLCRLLYLLCDPVLLSSTVTINYILEQTELLFESAVEAVLLPKRFVSQGLLLFVVGCSLWHLPQIIRHCVCGKTHGSFSIAKQWDLNEKSLPTRSEMGWAGCTLGFEHD